jgi:hypothetical protein
MNMNMNNNINININMMASRHHGQQQQQLLGKKRPRSAPATASASATESESEYASTTIDNNKTISMQRRRTRRVHFSSMLPTNDSITRICIGRSETYQDLINDVWYTKNELAVFTNEAREYVLAGLRLRGNGSSSNHAGDQRQHHQQKQSRLSCECSRGYERYDFSRVQQKALTRKVILLACSTKTGLSSDEMAMIARKSSSYAVQEAFVTGFQDYCDVYHLQVNNNTPKSNSTIVQLQQQQQSKQQQIEAEDEDDASTISSTSTSDNTSSTVNYDVTPPVTPPSCKRLRRSF